MRPLHADEIKADETLVRELLRAQCPAWAPLDVVELESAGSDNRLFRLGADKLVRLPRRPSAELQVCKEHEWLPRLARHLPLDVPRPLVLGNRCAAFPWSWSVYPWIEGRAAEHRDLIGTGDAAIRLGRFVNALQAQDARFGPRPGPHNAFRGEGLIARDAAVRRSLDELGASFDRDLAHAIWSEALDAAPHGGPPKWIHGDLLPGNLLVSGGALVAVIDFGLLGVGDPACDLMAGWTLFDAHARACFRQATDADEAAWTRGRGWALAFAAVAYPYYQALGHPLAAVAARAMGEVLSTGADGAG